METCTFLVILFKRSVVQHRRTFRAPPETLTFERNVLTTKSWMLDAIAPNSRVAGQNGLRHVNYPAWDNGFGETSGSRNIPYSKFSKPRKTPPAGFAPATPDLGKRRFIP